MGCDSAIKDSCGTFEDIFPMIFIHFLPYQQQNYKDINFVVCENKAPSNTRNRNPFFNIFNHCGEFPVQIGCKKSDF